MASIAKTAFEVSVSNITRNNVQNVPGYFGSVSDSVFTGDICPSGFLVIRNALVKSEGYEAQNIKNGNTWQMITATNGAPSIGRPGDRTGIFAFNTYDVRQVDDGLNLWKLGANFLGLELPAGIRGDFTEIIIGEQYTFGEGNFSTPPANASAIYATISNGLLVASSSAPADGSGLYFEILRSKRFTEGGRDAGFIGYVCEAKRAAIAIPDPLPAATASDENKMLAVNGSGQYELSGNGQTLAKSIQQGGLGWTEPGEVLWSGTITSEDGNSKIIDPAVLELEEGTTYSLSITVDGVTTDITETARDVFGDDTIFEIDLSNYRDVAPIQNFRYSPADGYNIINVETVVEKDTPISISTPVTVHKIDDDFLPASGGVFVVNFTAIDNQSETTADKTPAEISAAATSGQVCIAFVAQSDAVYYLINKSTTETMFSNNYEKIFYNEKENTWTYNVIE